MQYLIDTVGLIRHLAGKGKIGRKASGILDALENGEDRLIVSVISLMEIMYLAEKHRINIGLSETLNLVESSSNYTIVDLNTEILRVAESIEFYELHDRLILATCKWLQVPIISSDSQFSKTGGVEVIWN